MVRLNYWAAKSINERFFPDAPVALLFCFGPLALVRVVILPVIGNRRGGVLLLYVNHHMICQILGENRFKTANAYWWHHLRGD